MLTCKNLPLNDDQNQRRAVDFLSMMQVFEMPPLQCFFFKITFDCDLKKMHKMYEYYFYFENINYLNIMISNINYNNLQ
jgi:predicted component of viral defense system (DUF524 family)